MPVRKPTISDQVRSLIEGSRLTRYQIWKATGIDQATLSRFMSGDGGLSTPNLDTLGELLGLSIVQRKRAPKRHSKKGK